mmetsp:Transcript_22884/g.58294  ORF Transcript_22884/g.58294 Transcript_22884/m.58294 type:complete len:201 (-) Transcript_22884:401-1003(-)
MQTARRCAPELQTPKTQSGPFARSILECSFQKTFKSMILDGQWTGQPSRAKPSCTSGAHSSHIVLLVCTAGQSLFSASGGMSTKELIGLSPLDWRHTRMPRYTRTLHKHQGLTSSSAIGIATGYTMLATGWPSTHDCSLIFHSPKNASSSAAGATFVTIWFDTCLCLHLSPLITVHSLRFLPFHTRDAIALVGAWPRKPL